MLNSKLKTGLFFGSFNPIHIGHLAIANYFLEFTELNDIWFVVSPQNPWKQNQVLLDQQTRVEMVELAIAGEKNYLVTDFEKHLPTPSYTYQSLLYLKEKHPEKDFVLIIGGDNLDNFHLWRNSREIQKMVDVFAYPRSGDEKATENIRLVPAPKIEMASQNIREWIKQGKSCPFLLSPAVNNYIINNKLYTQ